MPQYFDPSPTVASRPNRVPFFLDGHQFDLVVDRGVFSGSGIDQGTTELLRLPTRPLDGALLDLGCGYGPIAIALAVRNPSAVVWAVDVNDRARQLTVDNAKAAGVSARVRVCAPDEVPDDVRFSSVWSNPPIRIGKEALHSLLARWLDRLGPKGCARLVVHKHLGSDSLARWLVEQGWPVRRLASRKGYRILEVGPR